MKAETAVTLADGSKCVFTEGAWEAIGEMLTRAADDDVRAEALDYEATDLSRPPDERRPS